MAYMDDLLRELEARNLTGKIYNAGSSSSQSSNSTQKKKKKDYTEELLTILSEDAKKNGVKLELSDYGTISADSFAAPMDDIAPVKTTVKKSEEADDGLLDFFQKGALGEIDLRKNFRDGYQFGDILKTGGNVASQVGKAILGTAGDVGLGVAKGFASSAEGIADLASYGIAAGLDALGKDDTAERWRKNASENTVEEWTKGADEYLNRYSMAGRTTDAISQGIGQIGSIIATGGLGKAAGLGAKAVTALTTGTMGLSGAGAGMGEAYRGGASDEEAATYGLIAGASDALTELLFGGLGKAVGAVGLSTGLSSADDLLAKKVSGLFTNQIAKNFAEYGIKAGAEGFEEVLAGTAQAIGKKITYMKEEELSEILKDENLLEQFVVGAAASGLMQSGMIPGMTEGSLKEANAEGRDFITGLNQNEQTVIDKEVAKRVAAEEEKSGAKLTKKEIGKIEKTVQEDMDKGYISIDTIEEALGGETYTNYKKVVDAEEKMQREYDELGKKEKYTLADDARYKELGERLKYVREKGAKNELRKRLDEQVSSMVKDSRLTESFAERSRRGQAFEADLTQYANEKQRAIVQKAVESGVLNNTNRTREFVNMVSKIAADKDISFDFANNAKLKETGFAVEGKTVNGFLTKDGITVNIQSAKALNSVVGHEITHVLEGTELYTELQTAAIEYAKTKGDYQGRYDALVKVYESVEGADIDAELTADLVGDYLFTDSDFINNLSANHRNVFQKIYDEVKYLLKVATAGSKEARELEKVKRAFEKAYREGGKAQADTKYSLAPVAAVQPKSGAWHAGASTEEVRAAHPTLYAVDETATEERNPTQVKGTVSSYRKVYSALQAEGFDGTILDASSGLGYGTKAGIEEFGFNVEDIEPYPDKNYHPKHTDYSALDKKYDVIISNAVLNVLPQDQRDALVVKMGELLNEGGRMFINVRGKDVLNASGKIAIDEAGMEYFIPRTAKTGSYQKGFTKPELIAYLQDALGDGFTVTAGSKVFGGSTPTAIVTKKGGAKYSLAADSEGRQLSAEQREYFKDSKVVDESGNLLTVYHGSKTGGFHTFRYREDVQTGTDYGEAFYFTSDRQKASGYSYDVTKDERVARYHKDRDALMKRFLETRSNADKNAFLNYKLDGKDLHELMNDEAYLTDGGEVKEVYLNLTNPLIADAGGEYYYKVYPEYFNQARENGNDGIIVKNVIDNPRGEARPIDVYIAFSPEQIKNVDNVNPTADPDIRKSLSPEGARPAADGNYGRYHVYGRDIALEEAIAPVRQDIAPATVSKNATVAAYEEPLEEESPFAEVDRLTEQLEEMERQYEATFAADEYEKAEALLAEMATVAVRIRELENQLDADVQERLASMEDADAPAIGEAPYSESTDTVTLPKKMVQDITRDARKALGFSAKQVPEMRTLVEKFSQGEIDSEQLHDEIAERFGTITETDTDADVAEVKRELRRKPINVADDIKSSFPDYTASVMRPNFGKIRFSNAKNADGVDTAYDELSDKYPGFFPKDIIQPADQLQRIIEVANMDSNTESQTELGEQFLDEVTDSIVRSVNEYKAEQRLKMSEQNAFESFNSLMRDADRYAPALEDDIAPVRADVAPAAPAAEPVQESAPAAEQPIKTVKERLEAKLFNLQTELQRNQQLREESNAEYEQEIAQLQTEYYERQNKNTKAANNLLRRMERLRRIQSDVDADYAKRINDLSEQVAKVSEEARTGESAEAQGAMRRELHQRIVENIRAKFMERGYDLETVLKNAKDLSTFATVDNTPQRVMEKALGYKEGQILADLTVNQVAANETKGIRWLNSYTDRKNGLLAQISKQYSIKPGSKESAAAQMYAEGFYVNGKDEIVAYGDSELAQDFPDAKVQANIKGLARDPRIRQIYDATLAMINESRARNAYPEIQKLDNYFLHFRAMDDTFSRLGIPFNPNDIRAKDLPTDLNGVTADLKPGQPYFASAMHRKGKKTSFDLLGGLEKYLTSAKGQIYHIDDIQTLRALRNHIADTYGQAHGLEGLDTMTEEEAAAQIEQVYDAHLSTFAKFLNEEANVIAGKTALIDRGLEGIIGRRGMTFFDTLNRQVGANMVGFNVSSSLTNFIAPVQAFAKTNKAAFVKGFAQTVANRIGSIAGKTDGFIENNPTMIRRQGADRFYRTPWQKAGDLGYALMGAVDSISTEIVVRGKYNELVSKGMSAEQAVIEADKWASRLMGDRSLGQQPQLYNSKMAGLVTKFQLEVRNQLDSQFYDTIQEAKVSAEDIQNAAARNAKVAAKVTSTFVTLAVTQHLFGKVFESIAGYNPAFDIIEAIIKAFGWDDEEESEDTVLDNLGQGLMSIAEDMPYSSVITDGGRIPISSALPITQLIKGEDKYGNEKSRWETIAETAPYYLLPGGYGQIKKTTQGLGMFDDDLPIAGSYTDSGNLRYPVEDTLRNRVQAAIFGQYASSNARDYFDNERQSLKKNQIQELVDVDIPIREYWDYREGLNEQETLADKFDYIAGLDLPIDKKNILINNVVDRKEAVDLTDYHDYADYEEFDFAVKNPEKYDFLQSVGVSVGEYNSFDDDTKDAYNWAYQNPEKYTLSRAVSDDVAVYRQYTKALNDISADKDADGKSISGSRKEKVIQYLNGLDADYYSKLILFKMEYNADDTYNNEIIEYLNSRNDISFEEEVTILRELGFTVTADGTVRW